MIWVASLLTGLVMGSMGTWASVAIAHTFRILDSPGEIKIHLHPTPRFGGLGIVSGTLLATLAASWVASRLNGDMVPFLIGGILMALTGAIDDIRGLPPLSKAFGQVMAGAAFVALSWSGLGLNSYGPVSARLIAMACVLFIVFMSNSLNLLDGMDGLAAGVAAIAALFLTLIALVGGQVDIVIVLTALAGACAGFLMYNAPPAKTFMGDVGSLFLGYGLAAAALELANGSALSAHRLLGLLMVLWLPVVDTALAIFRRFRQHRSMLLGDRFHTYDCVLRLCNSSTWKTLVIMWATSVIFGIMGILVFLFAVREVLLLSAVFIFGAIWVAIRAGSLGLPR